MAVIYPYPQVCFTGIERNCPSASAVTRKEMDKLIGTKPGKSAV